jgi:hypothetical protein
MNDPIFHMKSWQILKKVVFNLKYLKFVSVILRNNLIIILMLILILPIASFSPPLVQNVRAPGAWNGQDLYHVPMSWCAVFGSQATNPAIGIPNNVFGGGSDFSLNDKLWRRHERVTEFIYQTPAGISFRSGINNVGMLGLSFPPIADPNSYGMLGQPGDIRGEDLVVNSGNDFNEFNAAIMDCRAWWERAASMTGVVNGITAINIRLFVDGSGNVIILLGSSGCAKNAMGICAFPYSGNSVVIDNFYTYPGLPGGQGWNHDPLDQNLGHELGHALSLNHRPVTDPRNALMYNPQQDNDGDGLVDNIRLSNNEIFNKVRPSALQVSGREIDPIQQIVQGDTVSSLRSDKVQEEKSLSPFVDISAVRVTLDKKLNKIAFGQELFGVIPNSTKIPINYWTLADLDNNTQTGASKEALDKLGVPNSNFKGSDLIIKAQALGGYTVNGSGWKVSEKNIIQAIPSNEVAFEIQNMMMAPHYPLGSNITVANEVPIYSIVNAILDNAKLGLKLEAPIRIQSMTQDAFNNVTDKLDDTQDERGNTFTLVQSHFAHCFPEGNAVPGKEFKVSVQGLLPNSTIHGLLGGTEGVVFRDQLDNTGNKTITFVVPGNATEGFHLMTIGVDDTALTADCAVTVKTVNATSPANQQAQSQ